MAEDAAMGKGVKDRGSMGFMQKYYHKGAFFMENDENNKKKEAIYNRDYNEALSEDKAVVKLSEGPYEGSKVLQVLTRSSRAKTFLPCVLVVCRGQRAHRS
jgi:hypothetical protein